MMEDSDTAQPNLDGDLRTVLKGSRITIRRVRASDLRVILRWWTDPVVMGEVRATRLRITLNQLQAEYWPRWENPGPADYHQFVICLDKRPVGEIGYRLADGDPTTAAVDIKIGEPELWGRGIGSAAMRLFVAFLREQVGVATVVAEPGEWNQRSLRLFASIGFREVGRQATEATSTCDGGVAVRMALDRRRG